LSESPSSTPVLVKISQEVREYAAKKELEDIGMATKTAMEEMAAEYNQKISAAYHKLWFRFENCGVGTLTVYTR
jgi:hypothetical protein